MSLNAQLLLIVLVTGLVVGGLASLAKQGRGLIECVGAGIIGALASTYFVMSFDQDRWLARFDGDPFVLTIVASLVGAVVFAAIASVLFAR